MRHFIFIISLILLLYLSTYIARIGKGGNNENIKENRNEVVK